MDCKPEQFARKLFDRIFEIARISNFTSEDVSEYEASLMTRWDYSASMKSAKEEGVALGEARGIALGRNEGFAIGRDEGEIIDVLRTARQMKTKGLNIALIAEITGLSEAEI
jgi:predicted transposase/invertase (TIGR01784 family)